MEKGTKIALGLIGVLTLGIGGYFLYKREQKKKLEGSRVQGGSGSGSSSQGGSSQAVESPDPLARPNGGTTNPLSQATNNNKKYYTSYFQTNSASYNSPNRTDLVRQTALHLSSPRPPKGSIKVGDTIDVSNTGTGMDGSRRVVKVWIDSRDNLGAVYISTRKHSDLPPQSQSTLSGVSWVFDKSSSRKGIIQKS